MNKFLLAELRYRILKPNSLRARLARGTFWTTIAAMISQLTAITAAIIAARTLGKTGFGELGMVRSTILMFSVLTGTSLGVSCAKYVAEYRTNSPERAGRIIGLMLNVGFVFGLLGTLLCFFLASPLAFFVLNAEQMADSLRIGCFLVGLNILIGTEIGSLNGLEAFHNAMLVKSILGILSLIFVSIGAWKHGVNGAITGYVVAAFFALFSGHIMLKQKCNQAGIIISHRHVLREAPILWKFALPAVLAGISTQWFEWLARVLLARHPGGFEQIGIVTAAMSIALMVQFLPQQVAVPLMPVLSNILSSSQYTSFNTAIRKSLGLLFMVGLAVAIPITILAPYLMAMYGSSFVAGVPVLVIISLTYGIVSITMVSTTALAATGRMWTQTGHKFVWGITMIISMYVLVDKGAFGMACSYAIANLVFGILQFITVIRLVSKMKKQGQSVKQSVITPSRIAI